MTSIFIVVRRSPDVSPAMVEIMGVCSTREGAQRLREEIFGRQGKVTLIEEYTFVDSGDVN